VDSILKKITERIRIDEKANFDSFDPDQLNPPTRKPLDVLAAMRSSFFTISEVKRSSPSRGVIREDFDPGAIADAYRRGGASAVSVVTEKNFFGGDKSYIRLVKDRVDLPVLRKDFILHPYQIHESCELGADFVLLIAACLETHELASLYDITLSIGMQAIVEVHDTDDVQKALSIEPAIIGINNRNLKTFEVDLDTSFAIKRMIPKDVLVVSESGISSRREIVALKDAGFSGVLIGESLLRQADIETALRRLLDGQD
jgi:indole-3-glycerol phosphate synthase